MEIKPNSLSKEDQEHFEAIQKEADKYCSPEFAKERKKISKKLEKRRKQIAKECEAFDKKRDSLEKV